LELEPPVSKRARWSLTPDAFERLLQRIADDRIDAVGEFEDLRRYLITLLTWAGAADAEHLADTTFDRAAKRLSEGETIGNLKAWLRGAARRVLQESRLQFHRESDAARARSPEVAREWAEEDLATLDECLAKLPPESRRLIEEYYRNESRTLAARRRELASAMGVSAETLRTRALRLRKVLERCFEGRRLREGE